MQANARATKIRVSAILLMVLIMAGTAAAQTYTVDTTNDTHVSPSNGTDGKDSNGNTSLRSALEAANNAGGSNVIHFGLPGLFKFTLGASPNISGTLSIDGQTNSITIDGQGNTVFLIDGHTAPANVTLKNLTITNGTASSTTSFQGGGVYVRAATLTLDTCTISSNTAAGNGGGIAAVAYGPFDNTPLAASTVTVTNCTIKNNSANCGGGILCQNSSLTITGGTIGDPDPLKANKSTASNAINAPTFAGGGGIMVSGDSSLVTINYANIFDNSASTGATGGSGGGIDFPVGNGSNTVSFNRIFGNSATAGSGIACSAGTPPSITDNWWQTITPSAIAAVLSGLTTPDYLTATFSAAPTSQGVGGVSNLTVNFTKDSAGNTLHLSSPDDLTVLQTGLSAGYTGNSHGSIAQNNSGIIQNNGIASATYTSNTTGIDTLHAIFDTVDLGQVAVRTVAPPTANSQSLSVKVNTPQALTLTGSDPNGPPALALSYTVTNGPTHGSISGTAPNLVYTPNSGFLGTDSLTFKVNNGTLDSVTDGTVSITVVIPPTADNQSVNVNQDTAKAITLTGADTNSPPYPLNYTVTKNPAHGSLSGTVPNLTYTPNAGYFGADSFQFSTNNGFFDSTTATVSLNVIGKPAADSQTVTTNQDTAAAITLTGSDPNTPALTLTFVITTNPLHGTLSGTAPNITYTPGAGYFGSDSLQFKVNNSALDSSNATVSITVVGKPTASGQAVSLVVDTPTSITLTGSDPNTPPLALSFIATSAPSHGKLTGTAPNLTFTPDSGYIGTDSLQFKVNNGALDSDVATVSLAVYGIPTASPQSLLTNQDSPLGITLTATDPNTPALPLSYAVTLTPAHGTLSGSGASQTYTPNSGFFGDDSFQFTASNAFADSTPATISIHVVGKPTANSGSKVIPQDTATALTLSGSDPNTPPLSLSYTVTANPAHGSLSGTAPNLTYTPSAGYFGSDSVQFKVNNGALDSDVATITLTVIGKPLAISQSVTVLQDTPQSITLTGVDSNVPPESLNFSVTVQPTHGTLSGIAARGVAGGNTLTLLYTPDAGYFGPDSFQFTASNNTTTSDPATVSITVIGKPTANDQTVTVAQDTATALVVTGSDPNSPPLTLNYSVTGQPAHGSLSGTAPNLTYTPNAGFIGSDSFTFTVNNGSLTSATATVTLTIVGKPTADAKTVQCTQDTASVIVLTGSDPNQPPLTLSFTIATQPSHGSLSGKGPNLTYTPNTGYFGSDTFTYTVSNGTLDSATATVNINVVGRPGGANQTVITKLNTAVKITLSGTDPNTPPRALSFVVTSFPKHGSVTGEGNPVTYTPTTGFVGTDSFQFTVFNGLTISAPATVTINVGGKPSADAQTAAAIQDTPTAITLTGNDTNTPPLPLTFAVTANPAHGTLSGTPPNVTYTPAAGYIGADSFQFTTNNTLLDSLAATVSITVSAKPPVITQQPQTVAIFSGSNATFNVTATGTALNYQWYLGASGDTSAPVSGATGASYTTPPLGVTTNYWVRVSNAGGNADSATATAFLALVNGGSTGGGGTPPGLSVPFNVNTGDTGATVTLDFGDGSTGSGANTNHTYAVPGTYTVTITLTNSNGQSSTTTVPIVVTQTTFAFRVSSASVALAGTAGKDKLVLAGVLHIPAGFNLAGQQVIVNIGGNVQTFVLNARGQARTGRDVFSFAVKLLKGVPIEQEAPFKLAFTGSLAAAIKASAPMDANGNPTQLTTQIQFNGATLISTIKLQFKPGKNGAATASVKGL